MNHTQRTQQRRTQRQQRTTPTPTHTRTNPYEMVKALESYFTVQMNSDANGISYRVACTLVVQALRGVKVFM